MFVFAWAFLTGSRCGRHGVGWCTFSGECHRRFDDNHELNRLATLAPQVLTLTFVSFHIAAIYWLMTRVKLGNAARSQAKTLEQDVNLFIDFIEAIYPVADNPTKQRSDSNDAYVHMVS